MKTYAFALTCALVCALSFSAPAFAESEDVSPESNDESVIYGGVIGLLSSEYLGSAEEDLRLLPYLSIQNYKGFDLFGPSLSYRAIEAGTGVGLGKWSIRAGPNITYQSGRDSGDSETLTGLEDIGSSVLLGGYTRATFGPVGLRFDAGQDILGGHDGLTANASIGTLLPLGPLKIQPAATVSWGSTNHNQSFFGITPEQAVLSGLDVNDAGAGFYSYSLSAVSWLELNDDYVITLIGSHRWFTGKSNNSPIRLAEDGSDTGVLVSFGLARRFNL